jgi:hypothetical protein
MVTCIWHASSFVCRLVIDSNRSRVHFVVDKCARRVFSCVSLGFWKKKWFNREYFWRVLPVKKLQVSYCEKMVRNGTRIAHLHLEKIPKTNDTERNMEEEVLFDEYLSERKLVRYIYLLQHC